MAVTGSAPRYIGEPSLRTVSWALGLFLVLWLASACQTSCGPGNQAAILYVDGKIHTDGLNRYYESTPYDGEWLDFQSNRRFMFQHDLHTNDYRIDAWLSFSSHPVTVGSDASTPSADVAAVSGDMMVVDKKTADTLIVRNDTCSQQYLYVLLTASAGQSDAGQ